MSTDNIVSRKEKTKNTAPLISPKTIELMVKWCEYHKDDEPYIPEPGFPRKPELSDWDRQFFASMDPTALFHVAAAAKYCELEKLSDCIIAHKVGKTTSEELANGCSIESIRKVATAAGTTEASGEICETTP
ncbi:hypothetical protein B9Z55_025582 [Caenorhabditis nigoni]|uniref:SKP1 component POZ domain-containing protein n=1 Tax=Caenorhabditis nigoni TaxID=1611254 RepID=A0A2G5SZS2_9PELO|nr:hypothetical protein B9Z55_025582 [Caenorhabditis nigoni]